MRKSKNIKALKNKAADLWKKGKRKEAHEIWEKARIERLIAQGKM